MHALSGYINDNTVVVNGNISSFEGYNVVITILDTVRNAGIMDHNKEQKQHAARQLAGLWSSHDSSFSVEDTVRDMRKGRSFAEESDSLHGK